MRCLKHRRHRGRDNNATNYGTFRRTPPAEMNEVTVRVHALEEINDLLPVSRSSSELLNGIWWKDFVMGCEQLLQAGIVIGRSLGDGTLDILLKPCLIGVRQPIRR